LILLQLQCHTTSIALMHNQLHHKSKIQNKRYGVLVECTDACLDPTMLASSQLDVGGPPNTH
jgi:hypothetical protein